MSADVDEPLTDRQLLAYRAIARLWRDKGRPPSYREVMRVMGWRSPNAIQQVLEALERKGLVHMAGGQARCLQLTGVSVELVPDGSDCGERARVLLYGLVRQDSREATRGLTSE